jgi:putative redox protein
MENREVVVASTAAPFEASIAVGPHRFTSDEQEPSGGDGGPGPYDLLIAALGACTSMTLKSYARLKQWPLQDVVVKLKHERVYAEDCAGCEDPDRRIDRVERRITLTGPLSPEQTARLLQIADRCPIHKTLTHAVQVRTTLA